MHVMEASTPGNPSGANKKFNPYFNLSSQYSFPASLLSEKEKVQERRQKKDKKKKLKKHKTSSSSSVSSPSDAKESPGKKKLAKVERKRKAEHVAGTSPGAGIPSTKQAAEHSRVEAKAGAVEIIDSDEDVPKGVAQVESPQRTTIGTPESKTEKIVAEETRQEPSSEHAATLDQVENIPSEVGAVPAAADPASTAPVSDGTSNAESISQTATSGASSSTQHKPKPSLSKMCKAVLQTLHLYDLSKLGDAVHILHWGTAEQQEAVASAIANVTPNSVDKSGANKVAVAKAEAIPPLVALLKAGSLGVQIGVQKQAARALHNITSKNNENKEAVVAAGAIPHLLAIMKDGLPHVQEQAIGVLRNCSGGSDDNKASFTRSGAVPALAKLLRSSTPDVQVHIAVILYNLANNSADRRDTVAPAIPRLVVLLKEGIPAVRKEVADTLRALTVENARNCRAIVEAGAMPVIDEVLNGADAPETKRKCVLLKDNLAKYGVAEA